jgi:hypothetical protein
MALFLLCPNLGWIQGQFNFTELSLRYRFRAASILQSIRYVTQGGWNEYQIL